jgi:hypothetical protein
MIILSKVSSFLMRRVVLVGNIGVSLVRCRCLWLPCCILFWVSCLWRPHSWFTYYFEDLLCCIYFNVFGCVFIGSCYVFLMGFFPRSVLWRWCMYCWERCLSTLRRLLCKPKVRYHVHNSLPLISSSNIIRIVICGRRRYTSHVSRVRWQ